MSSNSINYKDLFCCSFIIIIIPITVLLFILLKSSCPDQLKFTVTEASLARFEFSPADPTNTLSYSLALNLTVRNPNKNGVFYFKFITAIAGYREKTFGIATLAAAPFQLGPRKTVVLGAVLEGKEVMFFEDEKVAEQYHFDAVSRVFSIDVKVALELRNITFGDRTQRVLPSKIDCDRLKVPLRNSYNNNDSSGMIFKATKCYNVSIFECPSSTETKGPASRG